MPPDLASPSTFCYQELRPGRRLEVSKRDAACYFDQLRLPPHLTKFMGRPRLYRQELLDAGCSATELDGLLAAAGVRSRDGWYPAARVWGMGFSWSSAVGQQVLMSLCADAGLGCSLVLSPAAPVPESLHLQFAVATDDVMIFSDVPGASATAARALDDSLQRGGVERKPQKDINSAHNCRCIGVDLVDGVAWCAPAERIWTTFAELLSLMGRPLASPRGMAAFLGRVQWYDLLARAKLACYSKVYEFTRLRPELEPREVSAPVLEELVLSAALIPYWYVDLQRSFTSTVLATDASTSFGYGGCAAEMRIEEVRAMSRLCSQVGEGVTLSDSAPTALPLPRDGLRVQPKPAPVLTRRLQLQAKQADFRTVFAVRATRPAHINILEAESLNLGLSWFLRRPDRHNKRLVILLDSRVALGGASKGRSSSGPLLRCLRRTAALTLAGQLQPYYVFVGTSDNPADAPSRGLLRRTRQPASLKKLRRYQQRIEASVRRLEACGNLRF